MKKVFLAIGFCAMLMFATSVGYSQKEQIVQVMPELHAHASNAP